MVEELKQQVVQDRISMSLSESTDYTHTREIERKNEERNKSMNQKKLYDRLCNFPRGNNNL